MHEKHNNVMRIKTTISATEKLNLAENADRRYFNFTGDIFIKVCCKYHTGKKHNIKQSAKAKERCQYYDIYPCINELNLYLFIFCHNEPPVVLILVF